MYYHACRKMNIHNVTIPNDFPQKLIIKSIYHHWAGAWHSSECSVATLLNFAQQFTGLYAFNLYVAKCSDPVAMFCSPLQFTSRHLPQGTAMPRPLSPTSPLWSSRSPTSPPCRVTRPQRAKPLPPIHSTHPILEEGSDSSRC